LFINKRDALNATHVVRVVQTNDDEKWHDSTIAMLEVKSKRKCVYSAELAFSCLKEKMYSNPLGRVHSL
jgi:hypothetical protein